MDRKQLPLLSTLLAFEAAGRLASFTGAARELNISQAAVSKQIKHLEAHVGTRLFNRRHRAVELTTEGREFLHTTVTALTHLRDATLELRAAEAPSRVCIAVDESVGHLWLMPRLRALMEAMPQTTFHFVVSDSEPRLLAGDVDVAILHGENSWPTHDARLLFHEEVFPVCHPSLLRDAGHMRIPADLLKARLIDLEDENWTWINWRIWLTDHGVSMPATHRALTFGSYPLVLEAARQGLGIALAWRNLIEDDLSRGTLVRPLTAEVPTRFGYYLAWQRARPPSSHALQFIDWVTAQFG
jgi:LysR family glycine cleavage system transcriptional activator